MRCPRPICRSQLSSVTDNAEVGLIGHIPADLESYNLQRRRRICKACGTKYHTVEILEDEFKLLIAKTGRLERPSAKVRPGA